MPDEHKKNFSLILGKMFFVGVEEGSHKWEGDIDVPFDEFILADFVVLAQFLS